MKNLLRWAIVVIVALVVGVVGLNAVFSDIRVGETRAFRLVSSILVLVCGGLVIGALLRSRWYLSVLAAWGPLLWGALMVWATLLATEDERRPGSWTFIALCIVVAPALTLLGGFLGHWIAARSRRSHGTT